RQDSAVTYVALCVNSAIAVEKRCVGSGCVQGITVVDYRAHAPRGHAVRDALRHTAVMRCQCHRG
ncbi:hypothetical protein, partial [Pseudomonas syringae]|uniref:hypothetical protein n=1 Tax=Pseudomonas syringae TaxID=317 RepID=UPI001F2C8429